MAGHLIKEGGLGDDGLSFFKTWCGIREVPTFFDEEELHEFLATTTICGLCLVMWGSDNWAKRRNQAHIG